jgi:hypothetical protein
MDEPHRINLSTAWLPPGPAAGRAAGRTAWVRWFGRPAGIEPGDRVWLVVEAAAGCDLVLGGQPLPPAAAATNDRHDVTAMLRDRNELVMTPTVPAGLVARAARHGRCDLPPTIGRVWLEIEPTSDPRPRA